MRLRISKIEAMASERPAGYVAAVLARGQIEGEFLKISSEAMAELRAIYRPERTTEPSLPSIATMARNAARAAAAEASARTAGNPALPDEEIARRLSVCQACANWRGSDSRCSKCGCYTKFKTRLRSSSCPVGKW